MGSKQDQEETVETGFFTDRVSHEMTIPSDPETSVFESLRKKYNTVSESVLKMFHNKKGHQEINKDQTWISGEKSEIDVSDTKGQTRKQSLETENGMVQPCAKSEIKLRNKNRFEPLSVFGLILISVLISTAGAEKLEVKSRTKLLGKILHGQIQE